MPGIGGFKLVADNCISIKRVGIHSICLNNTVINFYINKPTILVRPATLPITSNTVKFAKYHWHKRTTEGVAAT
jgi:hypothetical protein